MILVTGGTGLVGSHLLYHLCLSKQKIRAIYRNKAQIAKVENVFSYYTDAIKPLFKKIEWVEACVEDVPSLTLAFKDITVVYHCAALVSFNPKDYVKMRRTNIKGTANMVNLSIDFGVKKFCYVSSIATLGEAINSKKITEENEWSSTHKSGYAITKYGAEQEVWRASQEGLNVVIVNPGVILGPGFWQSGTGLLVTNIYKGLKFYALGITGFVGVNDVAKVMIALTESKLHSQRYILVSENLSFKCVFDTIATVLQVKKPRIRVTKFLGSLAWRLDWLKSFLTGKPPLFTKDSSRSLVEKTFYCSKKIEEALNLKFKPISNVITDMAKFLKKESS
ncbi:MAG: NAD-dependent epimerase/dehydratase family protein [Flavobacteriaceae bacterium]